MRFHVIAHVMVCLFNTMTIVSMISSVESFLVWFWFEVDLSIVAFRQFNYFFQSHQSHPFCYIGMMHLQMAAKSSFLLFKCIKSYFVGKIFNLWKELIIVHVSVWQQDAKKSITNIVLSIFFTQCIFVLYFRCTQRLKSIWSWAWAWVSIAFSTYARCTLWICKFTYTLNCVFFCLWSQSSNLICSWMLHFEEKR